MAQPPDRAIMSRLLVRSTPFVTPRTFGGLLGPGADVGAEFDTLEGFADPNFYNNVAAFPGVGEVTKAVGPWLDAAVFSDQPGILSVEYAIDRGALYRQPIAPIVVPGLTFQNISGLRITARFVRVLYANTGGVDANVEFGIYVRSQ